MFPYKELSSYICSVILLPKESKTKIKVIFSKEARELLSSIPEKARRKVLYNIDKVANGEMDKELFKKLEHTDIWEFRTLYAGVAYRILAFWDTEADTLVIAANGFIKKTQKTPSGEISKAEEIRERYFKTKSNNTRYEER